MHTPTDRYSPNSSYQTQDEYYCFACKKRFGRDSFSSEWLAYRGNHMYQPRHAFGIMNEHRLYKDEKTAVFYFIKYGKDAIWGS